VLKLYLSALPEPLLTCNLYKGFLSVHTLPSLGRKLHTLRLLVSQVSATVPSLRTRLLHNSGPLLSSALSL
jgi:hypothetical protein